MIQIEKSASKSDLILKHFFISKQDSFLAKNKE